MSILVSNPRKGGDEFHEFEQDYNKITTFRYFIIILAIIEIKQPEGQYFWGSFSPEPQWGQQLPLLV